MKAATVAIGITCLVFFATSPVIAQSPVSSQPEMRALLLRQAGWMFEWKPGPANKTDANDVEDSGKGQLVFKARGNAIVVTMRNEKLTAPCENPVTLSDDTVVFDGCNYFGITLRFDSSDADYPFKGTSPLYEFRLKMR